MDPADAREIAQRWTRLLSRRWAIYADAATGPMSLQEAIGTCVERHLAAAVPDGERFVFCSEEQAALIAVVCDDAVYVSTPSRLHDEPERVTITTQRFAFDSATDAAIAVEYSVWGNGGHLENWTFTFEGGTLAIQSFGWDDDRDLLRVLGGRLGWPVPTRAD